MASYPTVMSDCVFVEGVNFFSRKNFRANQYVQLVPMPPASMVETPWGSVPQGSPVIPRMDGEDTIDMLPPANLDPNDLPAPGGTGNYVWDTNLAAWVRKPPEREPTAPEPTEGDEMMDFFREACRMGMKFDGGAQRARERSMTPDPVLAKLAGNLFCTCGYIGTATKCPKCSPPEAPAVEEKTEGDEMMKFFKG